MAKKSKSQPKFQTEKPENWPDIALNPKDTNVLYMIYEETSGFVVDFTDREFLPSPDFTGTLVHYTISSENTQYTIKPDGTFEQSYRFWDRDISDGKRIVTAKSRREVIDINRFVDGKEHCEYGPASEETMRYFVDFPDGTRRDRYNYKPTVHYMLNGRETTKTAWQKAVKNGIAIVRESRIKFNGTMLIGEELELGGNGSSILWVRNGEELWALDLPHRQGRDDAKSINAKRREMEIDEKDKERYFLTTPDKLEDMVGESFVAMLKSTTPT